MNENLYIAVDLGAGSGRVFLVGLDIDELFFEEVSRFSYPPQFENKHLHWNFSLIFAEIKKGLRLAGERANDLNREIYSIGVDSWAVDYGLLDAKGELSANPVCYRDARTNAVMVKVLKKHQKTKFIKKQAFNF